jgi:hypothetical protein
MEPVVSNTNTTSMLGRCAEGGGFSGANGGEASEAVCRPAWAPSAVAKSSAEKSSRRGRGWREICANMLVLLDAARRSRRRRAMFGWQFEAREGARAAL